MGLTGPKSNSFSESPLSNLAVPSANPPWLTPPSGEALYQAPLNCPWVMSLSLLINPGVWKSHHGHHLNALSETVLAPTSSVISKLFHLGLGPLPK